ncbi:hypothetical protein RDI58_005051 [Solanum bulbocastanum]|uniref:Serine protease n=1 Tax=Solanum bulbocastanum TaxID=147425 RepID=A0AAN8YKQ5_SOLBU
MRKIIEFRSMTPTLVYPSVVSIFFLQSLVIFASHENNKEIYIVHLDLPDESPFFSNFEDLHDWHHSFLPSNTDNSSSSRMVYSYRNVLNGFAAMLTPEEVTSLQDKEGIISVRPRQLLDAQTTHSTNFLGLHQNLGFWEKSNYGKGMIIGVLDSGIMPDHPFFHDEGVAPPPARWKGKCEFNFTVCNNKLIGARCFHEFGNGTPLDENGQGTHTSSTAAGNFVDGTNFLGLANGTASEVVALGGFTAMQKGILVSCSAGNAGPIPGSVFNGAPWLLTVGASTTDRKLRATIRLGDGKEIDGESVYQPKDISKTPLPLIFPGTNISDPTAAFCNAESLKNIDVKGKVVLGISGGKITRIGKGSFVKDAGGAGMIFMNSEPLGFTILADPHVLPAAHGTIFGDDHAPVVAGFSGRGPNLASPGILKPDIIGPGVNILAEWPKSIENNTDMKSTFNLLSSTSMSCPHVSGIATLVKSAHPDWSPAAIKSAIMTTTDLVNLGGKPIEDERGAPADFFATGAGHVNPLRASDPGLIYDIQPEDYVPYLCGLNY